MLFRIPARGSQTFRAKIRVDHVILCLRPTANTNSLLSLSHILVKNMHGARTKPKPKNNISLDATNGSCMQKLSAPICLHHLFEGSNGELTVIRQAPQGHLGTRVAAQYTRSMVPAALRNHCTYLRQHTCPLSHLRNTMTASGGSWNNGQNTGRGLRWAWYLLVCARMQ